MLNVNYFKSKFIVVLVGIFLITFLTVSVGSAKELKVGTLEKIKSKGKLTISTELGVPPMAYEDPETGKATGYAIEIARGFAESIGVDLVIKDYAWSGVLPALEQGKVDLVASTMTRSVPRAGRMLITEPILNNPVKLLVKQGSDLERVQDAKGREDLTFAIAEGSIWIKVVKELLPKVKVATLPTTSDCVTSVKVGRTDVYVNGRVQLQSALDEYPESFKLLDGTLTDNVFVLATRYDSFSLWHSVNTYLRNIKVSGRLSELMEEFLGYKWEPQPGTRI